MHGTNIILYLGLLLKEYDCVAIEIGATEIFLIDVNDHAAYAITADEFNEWIVCMKAKGKLPIR